MENLIKSVFINGNNAKSGGGKTILQGIIKVAKSFPKIQFVFLVPRNTDIELVHSSNIKYESLSKFYQTGAMSPWTYWMTIPKILKRKKVDLVINLGDLVINTNIKQTYVFDWAYAVYDDKQIWNQLSKLRYIFQKIKLYFISKNIHLASYVYAQTEVIKQRLIEKYGLDSVSVLGMPESNISDGEIHKYNLPAGKKFIYLSNYYPHKNYEILIDTAKILISEKLRHKIFVTIEPEQHPGAKLFLNDIEKYNLGNTLINLGSVKPSERFSLMSDCDALLMPTLLETYGLPYIEAMQSKIPIFTSDLDFSRCVCGDAAFYFDPLDASSIVSSMNKIINEDEIRKKLIEAKRKVSTLPSWTVYLERLIYPKNSKSI